MRRAARAGGGDARGGGQLRAAGLAPIVPLHSAALPRPTRSQPPPIPPVGRSASSCAQRRAGRARAAAPPQGRHRHGTPGSRARAARRRARGAAPHALARAHRACESSRGRREPRRPVARASARALPRPPGARAERRPAPELDPHGQLRRHRTGRRGDHGRCAARLMAWTHRAVRSSRP
jgi:hypothetical protein